MTKEEYIELMGLKVVDDAAFEAANRLYMALPTMSKKAFADCLKASSLIEQNYGNVGFAAELDPLAPLRSLVGCYEHAQRSLQNGGHDCSFLRPLHETKAANEAEQQVHYRMEKLLDLAAELAEIRKGRKG